MDFTVIIVALMISFGKPLRDKVIREYRKKKEQIDTAAAEVKRTD